MTSSLRWRLNMDSRSISFRRRAVVPVAVRNAAVVILGVFYGGRDYEQILRSQDWSD